MAMPTFLSEYASPVESAYLYSQPFGFPEDVENGFWQVIEKGPKTPMYECYERGLFRVRIGRLTSFSMRDMNEIVTRGYHSYLFQDAFGDFPVDRDVEEKRLRQVMFGSFNPNQTFVSVVDALTNQVVGGTIVNPGMHVRLLRYGIGQADSLMPTLSALHFDPGGYGDIPETNIVNYSRFWHLYPDELIKIVGEPAAMGPYKQLLSSEILSAMARASKYALREHNQAHSLSIADTLLSGIVRTCVNHYGAVALTNDTVPTDLIRMSPLHWHYDIKPSTILIFEAEKQYEAAQLVDESLGKKVPYLYSG